MCGCFGVIVNFQLVMKVDSLYLCGKVNKNFSSVQLFCDFFMKNF